MIILDSELNSGCRYTFAVYDLHVQAFGFSKTNTIGRVIGREAEHRRKDN